MQGAPFSNNKAVEPTVTVETDLNTNKAERQNTEHLAALCI